VQSFTLVPFPAKDLPNLGIACKVERIDNQLSLRYEIKGDIEEVILPEPSNPPARKDDLWRATCFEIFLALQDKPHYWEFNMSPSGDWNAYRMDAYRRVGFQEERLIRKAEVKIRKQSGKFVLNTNIDLMLLFQKEQVLEAGITAVIQTTQGTESYWALVHTGQQADFHLRESFTVIL